MKNLIIVSLFLSVLVYSCSAPTDTKNLPVKTENLDSLVKAYHEERLKLFPLEATAAGDNRYNDLFPNTISLSYRNELKSFYNITLEALKKYNRNALSENDQMNYDVLLWECNIALEGDQFKSYLMPLNQFSSLPLYVGQLASGSSSQPFKTVKDYQNWLARLNAYVVWCDSAISNMKIGMAQGYTIPKSLTLKTIPQFADLAKGPVENHLFYSPIKNFPIDFSEDDKKNLNIAYKEIISNKIIPIHQKMADFLQKEYLPACRASSGISDIPAGAKYYNYLIKQYTTTNLTADEIFKIGQNEVERISNEMIKVKEQVGFKGDLKAFFNELRTKKELTPFTKPAQVISNFEAIHQKMKPNLEKLFK